MRLSSNKQEVTIYGDQYIIFLEELLEELDIIYAIKYVDKTTDYLELRWEPHDLDRYYVCYVIPRESNESHKLAFLCYLIDSYINFVEYVLTKEEE